MALTQNVVFAERAGLLQEKPRIHTVPVKFVQAGQHSKTLLGRGRQFGSLPSPVAGQQRCPFTG